MLEAVGRRGGNIAYGSRSIQLLTARISFDRPLQKLALGRLTGAGDTRLPPNHGRGGAGCSTSDPLGRVVTSVVPHGRRLSVRTVARLNRALCPIQPVEVVCAAFMCVLSLPSPHVQM